MKSLKKLIAYALTFAITLAYVPATFSFAEGNTTLVATSSANASDDASGDSSSNASKNASATTEAASAEASKDAASGDASKDAASKDASKDASANATGTTETAIVSITFANEGNILVGKDSAKTLLADQSLTVTDADKDGKLTAYDVFAVSDEKFNLGGFATNESGFIIKLFGLNTSDAMYTINNDFSNSIKDVVKNGDYFYSFIFSDKKDYTDLYTFFTPDTLTANVGEGTTYSVTLNSNFWGTKGVVANTKLSYVAANGTISSAEAIASTDASGNALLTFDTPGTYYIAPVSSANQILVPSILKVVVKGSEDIAPVPSVKKPGKVASLKAKVKKNNAKTKKITLSWKKMAEAEYYRVYISKKKSKGFKLAKQVSSNSLTLVKKKGTYYVKVKAYNSTGAGSYSKVLKVKAK